MAPTTSHAAAVFNSKLIPVLQIDDLSLIERWLAQESEFVLVVDPQRAHILNYTRIIKEHKHAKEELEREMLLSDGLFTYPLTPVTPTITYTTTPVENARLRCKKYLDGKKANFGQNSTVNFK